MYLMISHALGRCQVGSRQIHQEPPRSGTRSALDTKLRTSLSMKAGRNDVRDSESFTSSKNYKSIALNDTSHNFRQVARTWDCQNIHWKTRNLSGARVFLFTADLASDSYPS